MKIDYDSKANKFLIKCDSSENGIVMGLPDRRFRKVSGVWAAPALRRNIQYMGEHHVLNNPDHCTPEAHAFLQKKLEEFTEKPKGDNQFPAWYEFKNKPMAHQDVSLKKFFPLDEAAVLYEQGLGKTYTSINLVTAWRMTNQIDSVVVVCPSSIKLVWEEQLEEHCPIPYQPYALVSGKYKAADKFIENRSDFQWLVVGIEGLSQGKAIDYAKRFMLGRKCAMIIDESSRIKTPNKIRTDHCIALGKMSYKRVILSGTAITEGVEDFYTQFKFLNENILGYDSYYSFRARYCVVITITVGYTDWGAPRTAPKIVGYKNEDELIKTIAPFTERVEKDDALDLPEKTFTNRYITMNPTQKKLYAEMRDELYAEIDGVEYEAASVLEQMLRLQQITGGHYPYDDGEKIVPVPIPGKNPKIAEVMSMLDEISGKVIIWCQFRPEIELVSLALEKAEIHYVEFHGGCKEEEKKHAVKSFRTDGKVKVFLATRAAAYGLTLIEAHNAIYYSQGYSLEQYLQSQDRSHRIGQKFKCNYTHLVCDRTVDVKIIKALAGKENLAKLVYGLIKEEC